MEDSILPKNLTLSYKKLHLYSYKKSQQKKVFLKRQIMKKTTKAVTERCSEKRMFFEILQNSQKNACASLFFNKVAGGATSETTLAVIEICIFAPFYMRSCYSHFYMRPFCDILIFSSIQRNRFQH